MTTGIVNTTVGGTVYSDNQLVVYQLDQVLLPRDFFVPKPPPPAPSPAKAKTSKKKSADVLAPQADDSAALSLKQRNGVLVIIAVAAAAFLL
ncbi:hypothetical protein QN277_003014 [Acacia crassicarpa]|nr:hypothetical protein QN277_003014 [Acacia crassicarpa]